MLLYNYEISYKNYFALERTKDIVMVRKLTKINRKKYENHSSTMPVLIRLTHATILSHSYGLHQSFGRKIIFNILVYIYIIIYFAIDNNYYH